MTAEEAAAYLRRFTLHGGLRTWGARMLVRASRNVLTIRIDMSVHNRDDDSKLIPITFEQQLDCSWVLSEEYLDHWMRCAFAALVDHELAESVKFDGRRVREVHVEQPHTTILDELNDRR